MAPFYYAVIFQFKIGIYNMLTICYADVELIKCIDVNYFNISLLIMFLGGSLYAYSFKS